MSSMKANTKTTDAAPVQVGSHTPGPWRIERNKLLGDSEYLVAGSYSVAMLFGGYDAKDANARLIAAAPALLEALKVIVNIPRKYDVCPDIAMEMYEQARAAIAQAEGQPTAGTTCPTANGRVLNRWKSLQRQLRAALEALSLCKEAVEDLSKPPSARMALVRDYATAILQAYVRH